MSKASQERGAALVLAVLTIVTVAVIGLWAQILPAGGGDLERYFPLGSGVSQTYRVAHPDGLTTFQASNAETLPGTDLLGSLTQAGFGSLMKVLGQDVNNFDVDAAQAALARSRFARVIDTEYQPGGPFTRTTTLYIVRPADIAAIAINDVAFDPPLSILVWPPTLNEALVSTGMINAVVPYTSTLTAEAREDLTTAVGSLKECLRVRSVIAIPGYETGSLSWFCAGVGLVRQESWDTPTPAAKRYEMIAVSAGGRASNAILPAPLSDTTSLARQVYPTGPAGNPALLWSFTEKHTNNALTTVVVPADGMLIYAAHHGGVLALDSETHDLLWRFQTGSAIYGSPVVSNGVVYVTSSDRKLYALDAASGALRWVFATRDALTGGAAAAAHTVVVASEDRHVYALDAGNGQERWRFDTGGPVAATPIIDGDTVYIGSDSGVLYALDLAAGKPRWAYAIGGAITAAAAAGNGVVYVASHDQSLYALKAQPTGEQGELLWSYRGKEELTTAPLLDDNTVYLALRHELWSLDAATGKERWIYRSQRMLYGSPLRLGSLVFIRREHDILALDAATGAERSISATSPSQPYAGLSSDGQRIFVGHFDGLLQVFADERSSQ